MSSIKARLLFSALGGGLFVGSNAVGTQYFASQIGYPRVLGDPLTTIPGFGRLYNPFSWWQWVVSLWNPYHDQLSNAGMIVLSGTVLSCLVGVVGYGLLAHKTKKYDDVHGTAHFASPEEIKKTGLLPPDGKKGSGVYCGAYKDEETGQMFYLRHDGPEHICALAPTRSGKGVGLVVPTLLSWPESVFVLDRKGENFAMTAGWRKKHAGNVILKFDPAEPSSGCSWNPLAEIKFKSRHQISETQNIALMVVDDDGKGIAGDHFRSAAYELMVGLILHSLYKSDKVGRLPGLHDVALMLTGVGDFAYVAPQKQPDDDDDDDEPNALKGLFSEMSEVVISDVSTLEREVAAAEKSSQISETDLLLLKSKLSAAQEAQRAIAGVGKRMLNTPSKELGSIVSTANNALSLYRDPIVGENTTRVDFRVADLMDHEKPVSFYSIMTPKNADRLRPLNRLLLTQIVLSLADKMEFDKGRSKAAHLHRLLLMLDEFPTLGKLEVFESALAYIAGYGMKAYIITQDVQQLYKSYTNYESIISNCHVRVAYAPNKVETAEWMSKMAGQTTVVKDQISTSGKRFGAMLEQVSVSQAEVQRPLMTPDEIMSLPGPKKEPNGDIVESGEMLIFVAGHPVIKGRQILYFQDPVFSKRSLIEPPLHSDVVEQPSIEMKQKAQEQKEAETIENSIWEDPQPQSFHKVVPFKIKE